MSYILGASGFSWAGSGFGSAEDEAPRRTREKNSGTQGICPTVRHETLAGGGGGLFFAIFPAIHKNKFPRIKITAKKFSRTNLLQSKYPLP